MSTPVDDYGPRFNGGQPRRGADPEPTRPPLAAIIAALAVAALVVVAVTSLVRHYRDTRGRAEPPTATASQITPPNLAWDGAAIISMAPGVQAGAVTVQIHTDYQCPACAVYEEYFGPALDELISSGQVVAHYHLRSFLDARHGNDASLRAGVAATCADSVNSFQAYHDAVFAYQDTGYPDAVLRHEIPQEIGLTGADLTTFQACYDGRLTAEVVSAMEAINSGDPLVTGTPTYLVNGAPVDLTRTAPAPAALLAAFKAAT